MKYSSRSLNEPGLTFPLSFPIKIMVEYRPGGVYVDHAPMVMTTDPESATDEIVRTKGWDRYPHFLTSDVRVEGGI